MTMTSYNLQFILFSRVYQKIRYMRNTVHIENSRKYAV